MKTLAIYLTRQFLARFALVWIGAGLFALAADLMETGKIVLARREESWMAVAEYSALRLPSFLSDLLPMAVLIAGLWTIGVLHRQRELVAILNTGLSPTGLIRLALLASLPLIILQYTLDDWVTPRTVKELANWNLGTTKAATQTPLGHDGWLWLYSGRDIIRTSETKADVSMLSDVSIFRRDEAGLLLERVDAPRGHLTEDGINLEDAVVYLTADASTRKVPEYRWRGSIDFETIDTLHWDPSDLSLAQLSEVIDNAGYGQRPTDLYRTWYHARLVAALQPFLMLLMSMSLIPSYSRTGSFAWLFLMGMAIGFAAFVLIGITTAMGEAGLLPPWLAAWAPVFALLALIARFILQHEFLATPRRTGRRMA